MARPNSTGYPFLILRRDGQYTYHRDLAPIVVGDVLLLWSGRVRTLAGKEVVKISFGTREKKTAQQRWTEVHPQVDALVPLAEVLSRHRDQHEKQPEVPRLEPARIRTMAQQAYHDVLACDDRCQSEPGFTTQVAEILLRLARRQGIDHRDLATKAELKARSIEQGMLKDHLIHRDTYMLDTATEESELDPAPLGTLPAALKAGDRLAPEQVEALASGIRLGEIASEVEERLKENGIDLPPDHVDRRGAGDHPRQAARPQRRGGAR